MQNAIEIRNYGSGSFSPDQIDLYILIYCYLNLHYLIRETAELLLWIMYIFLFSFILPSKQPIRSVTKQNIYENSILAVLTWSDLL